MKRNEQAAAPGLFVGLTCRRRQENLDKFIGSTGRTKRIDRTQVNGYGRSLAGKVTAANNNKSGLKSAVGSGTIQLKDEAARRYWRRVTDEAISSVPRISVFSTPEINDKVQSECRRILKEVKGDKIGTEATVSIALDNLRTEFLKGETGAGTVDIITLDRPYISIHNHPSCETLSNRDLRRFISQNNAHYMVVVGNNGSIYFLEKTGSFNWIEFGIKTSDISGLSDYCKRVLEGAENYDLHYYQG